MNLKSEEGAGGGRKGKNFSLRDFLEWREASERGGKGDNGISEKKRRRQNS